VRRDSLGLLPASPFPVSGGAASVRPREPVATWRGWCLLAALVTLAVALVPPLATAARRTEYAQALQFSLLAVVIPALTALGAPWGRFGRGSLLTLADRLADGRRRRRELARSLGFVACGLAAAVAWHTPAAVAASASHSWLAPLEAATLLLFGLGLWLELVASPPLVPRSGHLRRAVLAAIAMWVFWIMAYVSGLSAHGFYRNFHHVAGGLSSAADQQIASAVLWLAATLAFVPLVFWNALQWLKTEDPDTELQALARDERRRGTPPLTGRMGGGAPLA
jgi:cytochrome c oxidase assembly factor CtaG